MVKVGEVTLIEENHTINVHCSEETGALIMDGSTAVNNGTIGDSLEWFFGEKIYIIDLLALFYAKDGGPERPAHKWEYPVFLMSHWKSYSKNRVHVRALIDLAQNESVFFK